MKKAEIEQAQSVDESLLQESAEQSLFAKLQQIEPVIKEQIDNRDYANAMVTTAGLRADVDTFFDDVMVMADDQKLRDNRLALLQRVSELCSYTADLSRLQPID